MPDPKPHILVIDDDIDTVNLFRLVLQKAGYRVTTASDWDEILEKLRPAELAADSIDLVILDIMMPDHSGYDVYHTIQETLHPVPPVIFLSAKYGIDDMLKASDLGAAKFLTKPASPEKLRQVVESVFKTRVSK